MIFSGSSIRFVDLLDKISLWLMPGVIFKL
jgi:hypothetical protein